MFCFFFLCRNALSKVVFLRGFEIVSNVKDDFPEQTGRAMRF